MDKIITALKLCGFKGDAFHVVEGVPYLHHSVLADEFGLREATSVLYAPSNGYVRVTKALATKAQDAAMDQLEVAEDPYERTLVRRSIKLATELTKVAI